LNLTFKIGLQKNAVWNIVTELSLHI
jgi:hypothetical protein